MKKIQKKMLKMAKEKVRRDIKTRPGGDAAAKPEPLCPCDLRPSFINADIKR